MQTMTCAAHRAHSSRMIARALTSTAIVLLGVHHAAAQDAAAPCVGADCPAVMVAPTAAIEATSAPLEPEADAATEGADLELSTVSVEAAAPLPEPVAAPARPRTPAGARVVVAPAAPVPAAPEAVVADLPSVVMTGDSRFAARRARLQDRTEIGRLTIDAPASGTAVSREDLAIIRSTSAENDLLLWVPGMSMVRNIRIPVGGKGYTNNLVDGFSVRSQSLGTFGFLDEVNLWDVEAVEVTRGPASVQYSSKAVGGTVNVISRTPPDSQESEGFVDVGAYGLRRVGLNFADPLGRSPDLKYSFIANMLDSDSWRDRSAQKKSALSGKAV